MARSKLRVTSRNLHNQSSPKVPSTALELASLPKGAQSSSCAEKRASKGSGSGADEDASVASTSTLASLQDLPGAVGEEDFVDPFERCLEALYEKRCALSALSAALHAQRAGRMDLCPSHQRPGAHGA